MDHKKNLYYIIKRLKQNISLQNLYKNIINILLRINNKYRNLSLTSKRIELDADKTLGKFNYFYSILYKFNIMEEMEHFLFIQNEKEYIRM